MNDIRIACAVNISDNNLIAVLLIKTSESNITQEELTSKAAEKFKNFKLEGGIHIVNEIPRSKTYSGKIDRSKAKQLASKLMNEKSHQASH